MSRDAIIVAILVAIITAIGPTLAGLAAFLRELNDFRRKPRR